MVGIGLSGPVLRLMGTPEDVMGYALTYLRVYFCGSIPSFLYNMGSSILRAIGDTRRPLYFLIAACLTNIVLDLFFVLALDLAVLGVAIATVLSQVVSAVLVSYPISWTVTSILYIIYYARGNWLRRGIARTAGTDALSARS